MRGIRKRWGNNAGGEPRLIAGGKGGIIFCPRDWQGMARKGKRELRFDYKKRQTDEVVDRKKPSNTVREEGSISISML